MQAYTDTAAQFLRAFKQAPWRTQTQAVAAWSITLLIIAVMGGLYLTVAARAGAAGRDLQRLEASKTELTLQNNELRATLAQLRSVTRLAGRARELGYSAAQPEQIEYLAVPNYPQPVTAAATVSAADMPAAPPASLGAWLLEAFQQLLTGQSGGG